MNVSVTCRCGKVTFEATGDPIVCATCYCASCQKAGRNFEQLPGAPAVLDANGGTEFVLYRKDRVCCSKGAEFLTEYRLSPDSPTRRVIAKCCNSMMFLDMTKGHWLSINRDRLVGTAPRLEMRVMTKYRPAGVELANDLPNFATHSGKFMWKLIAAWIAMGFRTPKIPYGKAEK